MPSLSYTHLERFARCPLSFRLHHLDRLPADVASERHFGLVVHRALAHTLREHVRAGRADALDPELAAADYRRAWSDSELRNTASSPKAWPWCTAGSRAKA
jgi:putative RecB family exonuclease